ncbi:MAG: 4Fe-4S binding protein [Desulfuromonas sp.]|nr:4Fe-4S binding protein [Desulfuromonas sp.]
MARIIITQKCIGCGRCVSSCRTEAISLVSEYPGGYGKKSAKVDYARCTLCGACFSVCSRKALVLVP